MRKRLTKRNSKTREVPKKTHKSRSASGSRQQKVQFISKPPIPRVRNVFIWSLIIATFFALLSLFSSWVESNENRTAPLEALQSKLRQAATLTLLNPHEEAITLITTGDVMLGRYVEFTMRTLKDYTYPFKNIAEFLRNADITFANLEAPFLKGRNTPKDSMTFRADPEGLQGLQFADYDVVSVANNHTMNYRAEGMLQTLATLRSGGIIPVGAGKNQDEAHTPAVLEVKGKKIAFYAYNDSSIPPRFHGEATDDKPGIARMDLKIVKNDVKNALMYADVVIVSMHAGKEYTREPTQFQKDFAHTAIDAGASLVIGHHPHWIQPVERYGKGLILYSLGNFVFDQFFSEEVRTGLVAKVTFIEDEVPEFELFPVRVNKAQPSLVEGKEKEKILQKIGL